MQSPLHIRYRLLSMALAPTLFGCGADPELAGRSPARPHFDELSFDFEEVTLSNEPEAATDIHFVPGSNELLLLTQTGQVHRYEVTGGVANFVDSVQLPNVAGYDDCGLVSVAFDPAFEDNGFIYFGHCTSGKSSSITRYVWKSGVLAEIAPTALELMVVSEPDATRPWHNVGAIGFDHEGAMWAQFGDKTVKSNAQDLASNRGKLLRFIPDPEAPGGHRPAPDNPLLEDPNADPDVYALGFRSPWKGVYDRAQQRWLVGDVGADGWEELNLVTAALQNFGWPAAEGPCTLADCSAYLEPLLAFPHMNEGRYVEEDAESEPTTGRAVWVAGPFAALSANDPYRGKLDGRFLFGDMFAGWVRALMLDEEGTILEDRSVGHLEFATAWTQGPDGFIYGTRFGDYKGHSDDPRARLYRALWRHAQE